MFVKLLIFLYFVSLIVFIEVNNSVGVAGSDYGKLETQVKALQRENQALRVEIYHYASYTTIANEAQAMGFIRNDHFIYLHR